MQKPLSATAREVGLSAGAVGAKPRGLSLSRIWFPATVLVLGLYVGLPWLAPVFMRMGWTQPGELIYAFYSTQCHQMAQRSFFLFGPQASYSVAQLGQLAGVAADPLAMREFIGSAALGWKVAWSDRMVSMYTSIFAFALLGRAFRRRLSPLPVWAFILLALPMAIDGGTHFVSDLAGFGQGFRDQNAWLAALTGSIFPATFYAGEALGSFNSWMRLLTGTLFGLGVVWTAFPHLERALAPVES
ncbi:MAG TPA: DUF2085 domain-containing protein [Anaerolineales bacterium]|nr:DUF2085 domain-containing protein [Anaerolineales bacterium]